MFCDEELAKNLFKFLGEIIIGHNGIVGESGCVAIEQLEDITEDLGAVAAIDLLDNEEHRLRFIVLLLTPRGNISLKKRLHHISVNDPAFHNFFAVLCYWMTCHISDIGHNCNWLI